MKRTDAEPLKFTGWFEREATLVDAACQARGIACTRSERATIQVGEASIDLLQLQRALDTQPPEVHLVTVLTWIDKSIAVQDLPLAHVQLAHVYPHLRSPKDGENVPWIRKLANDRLLYCLVSEDTEAMRYLGPIALSKIGVSHDQVVRRAKQNLGLMPPYGLADCTPHKHCPNVWIIETQDGHDAARLLIADAIAGGSAWVWIPHRDRMVLSTASPQALAPWVDQLREEAIGHAQQSKHPITAEAFWVERGTVTHVPYRRSGPTGRLMLPQALKLRDAPP